jgi:hypothetical protein
MAPPIATSITRQPACCQVTSPRAKTKSTDVGIWNCPPRDRGSLLAMRSATSMAMSTDHQVTPTQLTHSVAASTPMPVPRTLCSDRPTVLHGEVETTSSVVSGAKMPKELGEIQ